MCDDSQLKIVNDRSMIAQSLNETKENQQAEQGKSFLASIKEAFSISMFGSAATVKEQPEVDLTPAGEVCPTFSVTIEKQSSEMGAVATR
mmetsp:Transcript_29227/g.38931  ORF Transcript_29227/g.38931 Transcript_29227/m.38931 type:complete len:90 (+) Transcript_29227:511-780(+)